MSKIDRPFPSAETSPELEDLKRYITAQMQAALRMVKPLHADGFISDKKIQAELRTAIDLAKAGEIDLLVSFVKGLNPSLIATSEAAHEWITAHGIMLVHVNLESEIYDFLDMHSNKLDASRMIDLYKTLASHYYHSGNRSRARFYLEKVLEHHPNDLEACTLRLWALKNIDPSDYEGRRQCETEAKKSMDKRLKRSRDKIEQVVSRDKESFHEDAETERKRYANAIRYLECRQFHVEFKHPLEKYEENLPKACLPLKEAAETGDISALSNKAVAILKKVTSDERRRFNKWFSAYLLKKFMNDPEGGMALFPFFVDNLRNNGGQRRGGQRGNWRKKKNNKSKQDVLTMDISKVCKDQFFECMIRRQYAKADDIYEFVEKKNPQLIPGVWSHAETRDIIVQLLNFNDFERALNLYAISKGNLNDGIKKQVTDCLKDKIKELDKGKRSDDLLLLFELVNTYCPEILQPGSINGLYQHFSRRKKYQENPLYSEILKAKIKLLWRNRQYSDARKLVNEILRKNASDSEALTYLFDIFLMVRDLIACRKIHEAMTFSSPEEIKARKEKISDLEETVKRYGTHVRDKKSGIRNNPIWGGKVRSPISSFSGRGITRGVVEEEVE